MATYLLPAQIHCLNFLSNAGFGIIANSLSELDGDVNTIVTKVLQDSTIQGLIGDWDLIWGPYVYTHDTTGPDFVADNTMMVLYSAAENAIVIAVAGTNAVSDFGWIQEDFNVSSAVQWSTVVGGNDTASYISTGTNTGLNTLLNLPGPNNSGTNLVDFLTGYLNDNTFADGLQLIVTGHSLGGALSPTLALYLKQTEGVPQGWNAESKVKGVQAWPTAGPTPGNLEFAALLSLHVNYNSFYNTLDVIPHAWQANTLAKIPTIYQGNLPTLPEVEALVVWAEDQALQSGKIYTQALPWQPMTGAFDSATDQAYSNEIAKLIAQYPEFQTEITALGNFFRFLGQLGYQHTTAYALPSGLNILAYSEQYAIVKNLAVPGLPTTEQAIMNAIIAYFINYIKNHL